jgi:hypothetical protein
MPQPAWRNDGFGLGTKKFSTNSICLGDIMVQSRCARVAAGLAPALVVLAVLAFPTAGRSQGSNAGASTALAGEIKSLVDIISQAMQQNGPNREVNLLNQALVDLLMALEGFSPWQAGKHHHGHGLGLIGAKGGNFSGISAGGPQDPSSAFSGLLNSGGIFLSPGSRLFVVQNPATPGGQTASKTSGAFAKGLQQTAMACCQCDQGNSSSATSKATKGGTGAQASRLSPSSTVGAGGSGSNQSGHATNKAAGTSSVGRGAGLLADMSGAGLVNIKGNNNTVTINLNTGTKQAPKANTTVANQSARNSKTNTAKTGNSLQKAKVEPKTSLAASTNASTGLGAQAGISGKAKTGAAAKFHQKASAANQVGKAKTGFGAGLKSAAGNKTALVQKQGARKGKPNFGPGNSGAARHRDSHHASAAVAHAKTSGSHKKGK